MTAPQDRIVKLPEATQITGRSRSSIYRMLGDPASTFPPALKLGQKSIGWRMSELQAWIASL